MMDLKNAASRAERILVAGHVRPDGDCVGSVVAAGRYLRNAFPDKCIHGYLETMPERFAFLAEGEEEGMFSQGRSLPKDAYDLCIVVDSSDPDRLGDAREAFDRAESTLVVDHHVSNPLYGKENVVEADASSTCEVLYGLMEPEYVDEGVAEALYIGIVTDSGGFRYPNTSRKTMEIAGELMEKGIPFHEDMDRCFYERTYTQTQLLGRTLLASMRLMEGKCIVAAITRRMMEFYGAKTEDIDGIIDQLRIIKGVEVAILLHETGHQEYKVSMRSNQVVDVSKVAVYFGGGGHVRAAGCTMRGSIHDVCNNLTEHIEMQLMEK